MERDPPCSNLPATLPPAIMFETRSMQASQSARRVLFLCKMGPPCSCYYWRISLRLCDTVVACVRILSSSSLSSRFVEYTLGVQSYIPRRAETQRTNAHPKYPPGDYRESRDAKKGVWRPFCCCFERPHVRARKILVDFANKCRWPYIDLATTALITGVANQGRRARG